jgi:hypothetical protein
MAWFAAIRAVLRRPETSVQELISITGLARPGTVRDMVRSIREAMASPRATELLAGLNAVFT